MKYDFDEVIERRGTYCTQWDYIEDRFGEKDQMCIRDRHLYSRKIEEGRNPQRSLPHPIEARTAVLQGSRKHRQLHQNGTTADADRSHKSSRYIRHKYKESHRIIWLNQFIRWLLSIYLRIIACHPASLTII